MSVIHPSLFHLLKKYPDRREQLKMLFKTSESFKSVCEDYHQCNKVLTYWSQSSENEALIRRLEYEHLLAELEDEIEQILLKTG